MQQIQKGAPRNRRLATGQAGGFPQDDWDLLYRSAPVGLALFDTELRCIRINDHLARISGRRVEDHLRQNLRDAIPELAQQVEPLLREVLDTGRHISDREIHFAAPGSTELRWWLASFHPLREGARIYAVSCAVQEITEFRGTLHALELTQHSVEHASDEILWLDQNGRFVYVNQTASRTLGYTRDELLRMSVGEVVPNQPPERYPWVWEHLQQHGALSFDSQHRAKDGRIFPVEVALNLVRFEGREYCFAVVRDISERKAAEARAELLARREHQMQEALTSIAANPDLWEGGIEGAVRQITEILARALDADRVSVWLLDPVAPMLRALDVLDAPDRHSAGEVVSLANCPDYLEAVREGRVVAAANVFDEPATRELAATYFRDQQVTAVVNAPIRIAGKVAALLCVAQTGGPRDWSAEEVGFICNVAGQVAHAFLNAERRQTEHVIQRLANTVSHKTGRDFFRSIVASLAEVFHADWAFVGELVAPANQSVRSLAMWANGAEAANLEYQLDGTPCAKVVSAQLCSYPRNLQTLFPRDQMLVEMGAEGYVGMPLTSSCGGRLGLLVMIFRRPIENVRLVEAGLAAFAARASAEMERLQNEDALRRSEERHRAFVANSTESVWRLEFDPPVPVDLPEDELVQRFIASGYLADANDVASRLRGGSTADEMIGMRLTEILSFDQAGAQGVRELVRNQFRFTSNVHTVRGFDGREVHMYRTGYGVVENGLLLRIWGTGRDVTALKRAEEEIRQLNATLEDRVSRRTAELRAAVDELQAFSYSASHDLRAPVLGIAGCSRALVEDHAAEMTPEVAAWVQRIRQDAEFMDRLLDSLLSLSRVTQSPICWLDADLSAMATEILAGLARRDPDRQVVSIVAPRLSVVADPALLRVVLENLIGNAWKFSREIEHAQIEVGSQPYVHEGVSGTAYFVRDNGAGFDPQYASRLFAAFQRLHAPRFEGTGIGLATVRRVIHRHGGRVWADSTRGQGATFYFTIGRPEGSSE